jgi:small subunit ribosomal protein YMR-31
MPTSPLHGSRIWPFPSLHMPHPSLPVLSARAHKPLISFIGKRIWPSCAHIFCPCPFCTHSATALAPAHPHPAAPPEYRKTFSGILQETQNTPAAEQSFRDFWDAPARFWRPKHHALQEFEIDAIQVCGETYPIIPKDADNTQSGGASLL